MTSPSKAIAAIPPTTPPTIAPIGGLLAAVSVVEPVGTMTKVVVTICPEELVVTYCEENVEETSLVMTDAEVGDAVAIDWVEAVDREDCELWDTLDWVDCVDTEETDALVDVVVAVSLLIVETGRDTVVPGSACREQYHNEKSTKISHKINNIVINRLKDMQRRKRQQQIMEIADLRLACGLSSDCCSQHNSPPVIITHKFWCYRHYFLEI
jgi:hypothetical protein